MGMLCWSLYLLGSHGFESRANAREIGVFELLAGIVERGIWPIERVKCFIDR